MPAVIFGAIAGVYVDRLDRRMILVVTNLLRAAVFLFLVFVQHDVGLILLVTALISTLSTFFAPAEAAMIPVIVDRPQLLAANSLYMFTLQAPFFLGFALLGPLVVNVSGQTVLLVIVAAATSGRRGLCWLLPQLQARKRMRWAARSRRRRARLARRVATTLGQLRDGFDYILTNRTVFWPLTYLAITASLVGVLGVLGRASRRRCWA